MNSTTYTLNWDIKQCPAVLSMKIVRSSCCVGPASESGSRGLCRAQTSQMGSTGAVHHLVECSLSLPHCTDTHLLQPGLCCTQTKAGVPELCEVMLYPNKLRTWFHRKGILNGNTKRVLVPLYDICKTSTGVIGYPHLRRMRFYLKN